MRTTLSATLAVALATVPAAAADRDAALAVLDQAIKAHGGADALGRARTAVRTGTGTLTPAGKDVPFSEETVWQLPERFRMSIELGSGPDRSRVVVGVDRAKGWQSTGGMVADLSRERLDELREEAYVLWLTTLTPLRQDGFELTPLPEVRVGGRPLAGVKAASKGHADVKLYFDKESGLLAKVERRGREAGLTVEKEYLFGNPRDFDGVKLPTRVTELRNGSRFADLTNVSYKFLRGVNDGTFARP
jgi:hypothetical protein